MKTHPQKDKKSYKKHIFCHTCKKKFNEEVNEDENYDKVHDNWHYTGNIKGLSKVSAI